MPKLTNTALIVVDVQNGCFEGEPPRLGEKAVVARINQLSAAVRAMGLVVFIQHTEPSHGFARGSEAWKLLPDLEVHPDDPRVEKEGCDSFLETRLHALLQERGVGSLVIVGCATDFCVDTTVRAAASLDYEVLVPSDAHTTRDRPHADAATIIAHHNYMWADLLLPRGRVVRVLPTEALLKEMAAW